MTDLVIRTATEHDAEAMLALITAHLSEGHLLPRELSELRRHADRFLVASLPAAEGSADMTPQIVACAELAPLSARVAEVRSLVVSRDVRGLGLAGRMVSEIQNAAKSRGFETLCAFTHDARFFVRQNFSIVPHTWLPEKIATDCLGCPLFRKCEQHAMMLPLIDVPRYAAVA
jgi:N-acetylglutamate synthase-like GNAT family acetyltransferase